ncbi:MAG: aspartate/glutamate racemase family protein [Gammaproteobacteria bacterium]|nr:aspartate/glutamate racemase family protein [Gammaproteobacteria bacterium]
MSMDTSIKVLYVNPVGFPAYDQVFADMASKYKYPNSAVDVASLNPANVSPKMTDLEFRAYESLIIADTVKAARQASKDGYDAMIIGCFYDPALADAREISGETVVVAPCQASTTAALNIANSFGVIIGEPKWEDQMRTAVYEYGYRDKCAGFRDVGLRVEQFHDDPSNTKQLLETAAVDAVRVDKAESIILGCTLEVGFFEDLQTYLFDRFKAWIPVIDSSIASLKAAENAALQKKFGWKNSRMWGMSAPPEDELAKFEIFQDEYQWGNIIHVAADGS